MEEDATQSRSLAQKLHAAREKIDGKLHDDTTLVILDFAVYLFCFGGLAVTVTVWSILVANQPTTSSFSGIVVFLITSFIGRAKSQDLSDYTFLSKVCLMKDTPSLEPRGGTVSRTTPVFSTCPGAAPPYPALTGEKGFPRRDIL
ncbi:hypothetical protein CSUI_000228 [Cystoisospora suis]|uniref:Transmembrane protein n=1 Tax=Cystoisospora suis TaxID=483139 RepID=A0A2C6LHT6_9APIC|nr:hypothetical protein CSUI_000228 [Cystoisospora suis]